MRKCILDSIEIDIVRRQYALGMILENVGCMSVVDMLLTGDSVGSLLLGVYMYVQETLDRRFLSISREMICTVHL